jgi:dTDP-4-dehydrorhamnose 3,5-epimerase
MGSVNDVVVTPLQRIKTMGGDVMHGVKSTDVGFQGFGEAYFSWISSGAVKAWKCHKLMTMNLIVPVGNVKFVFFSMDDCKFRVENIGIDHYSKLTVPPGIWFGFKGLSSKSSLVLNISSIVHDPSEVDRLNLTDIEYSWE